MKLNDLIAVIAVAAILSSNALAQGDGPNGQRAAAEAERAAAQSQRAEAESARARLESARRELEAAAREVARASADRVAPMMRTVFLGRDAELQRAVLGLNIVDVDRGVRVVGVTPNGAAAKAGVQTDDLITAIDGRALVAADGEPPIRVLFDRLGEVTPGDAVELTLSRGDATQVIEVLTSNEPPAAWFGDFAAAAPMPSMPAMPAMPAMPPGVATLGVDGPGGRRMMLFNSMFAGGAWGSMQLVELTPALGEYFGTAEGLLVLRAPEDEALQLVDGDVILDIGGRVPTSAEHAMRILASFEPAEKLELAIMRQKRKRTVSLEVPARPQSAGVRQFILTDDGVDVR